MSYEFKVGDTGKTRGGQPYRVLATDANGGWPLVALVNGDVETKLLDGRAWSNQSHSITDLLPPTRTVTTSRVWEAFSRVDGRRIWSDVKEPDPLSYKQYIVVEIPPQTHEVPSE